MSDFDTEAEDVSTRNEALRRMLVATATVDGSAAGGPAPRAARRRMGAVALAVAGLLVGGAAGAAVMAAADPGAPSTQADADAAIWVKAGLPEYDTIVGDPQAVVGSGMRDLAIGAAPAGATLFSWSARCLSGDGTLTMRVGTDAAMPALCDGTSLHFGEHPSAAAAAGGVLHISASRGVRWAVYYGWVAQPPMPSASSAEMDAVADGVVTRSEYLASFNRFAGCMNSRGNPMIVPETALVLAYAAHDVLALDWCYAAEFQDADVLWQSEHPAPDGTDSWAWGAQPYASVSDPLYNK